MKSTTEIARMLNLRWNLVDKALEDFEPVAYRGRTKFFDDFQVDLICEQLYLTRQADYLTFESRLNKC